MGINDSVVLVCPYTYIYYVDVMCHSITEDCNRSYIVKKVKGILNLHKMKRNHIPLLESLCLLQSFYRTLILGSF